MAKSLGWLTMARENLKTAHDLAASGRWRPACSRAYYAAHQGAHAVLAHFDAEVAAAARSLSHGELPVRLYRLLRQRGLMSDLVADVLRRRLIDAYNIRVEADYRPDAVVGRPSYGQTHSPALQVIELARRLIDG